LIAFDTESRQGGIVQVAAASYYSIVRRNDGVLFPQGRSGAQGTLEIPRAPPGLSYTHVAAGGLVAAGILSDGSITGWGSFFAVPYYPPPAAPPGVTYVQLEAGQQHLIALRSDGAIVAWGFNGQGQCNVPPIPANVQVLRVQAGHSHSLALLSDGTIGSGSDPEQLAHAAFLTEQRRVS